LSRFYCGLLGLSRGRFLSIISSATHTRWPPSRIWFPSHTWQTPVGWFIRFFCGLLWVTRGRFLSLISSTAHPRWPLCPPSWIWFP
jgi:hypothetical protein